MIGLRHKVLNELRGQILSGTLKSGELILERELATRFETSKTPVREALALLCEEGLVQLFPRRGYMVRAVTLAEIIDTFDLRLILESAASERAATRIEAADISRLRDLARYDCCAGQKVQLHGTETLTHSFDFHVLIARASGNAALATQVEKLLRDTRRLTAIGFTFGEHDSIVDAIEARDPVKARRAMEAHIASGREAAVAALSGQTAFCQPCN